MNYDVLDTSALFLQAAASYFGLPPDQLILGKQGGAIDGTFTLSLTVAITPDDLVGITNRMVQMADHRRAGMPKEQSDQFDAEGLTGTWKAMPSVPDVIRNPERYIGVPEYADVVERAARLSKKVRDAVAQLAEDQQALAEAAKLMAQQDAQGSEGVGGRKVVHVDVPEEQEAESDIPMAVWVDTADLQAGQYDLASDSEHNGMKWRHLLQIGLLTPEQKAKYCGEQKS